MSIWGNVIGGCAKSSEWQLVGSASGSNIITLPSDFSELHVEVAYWSTCGVFVIPKISLTDDEKYYIDGFHGTSSSSGKFYICVSNTTARIYEVYFDGTNVTNDCVISIYKR